MKEGFYMEKKYIKKLLGDKVYLSPISLDDVEEYTQMINNNIIIGNEFVFIGCTKNCTNASRLGTSYVNIFFYAKIFFRDCFFNKL